MTKPWGAYKSETWTQSVGDVDKDVKKIVRRCEVSVGVFDPENKKCWSWPEVDVVQEKGDSNVSVGGLPEGDVIKEIDCGLLK